MPVTRTRPSHSERVSPLENNKGTSRKVSGKSETTLEGPEIIVCGQRLQPSPVFDTFFRFAAERQAIDDRRRNGQSAPWTEDTILQNTKFCNVFRVLDRLTQYIIREVIEKDSQIAIDILFRIVLFNTFTKIETYELLRRKFGPLTWAKYDHKAFLDTLERAYRRGDALYTGAFQKPAPHLGSSMAFQNHLELLYVIMNELPAVIRGANYLVEIYEFLAALPGMGPFAAYQLLLNLSYAKFMNFHESDFVVAGPGALSGLYKMFGNSYLEGQKKVSQFSTHVMRWMQETQQQHFARLNIEFSGLGPQKLPMQLCDIEHTLCEVDKYSRVAHPQISGLQKRTRLKAASFTSTGPLPSLCLPKAWAHPSRKIPRIREEPPHIEQRYVISSIRKHEVTDGGRIKLLVHWLGYGETDDTWEDAHKLRQDAPETVNEYVQAHGLYLDEGSPLSSLSSNAGE
ncbi:hypothetical protein SISSUDRAFT_1040989 [Sistotremastrum suecicum HHB10207 ss-3]|uniref:Chromo domain-containing protein n=1 Tax=Sistotremastrum suecicum HHB10207 ss-3 TaxID=1314776 RepID=A0A166HIB6_9AGAM|nr:hypothetical protein SISSUDRAFT_1040989 [Sistotremastrum suecicum HHB10207 ss-3]